MAARTVRWATVEDVAELVRLRRVMFDSMELEVPDDAVRAMDAVMASGLADGSLFAAVVDAPAGGLAACGIGMTAQRVPGPHNLSGRYGYVQSMVTDGPFRREGAARAVLDLLMARFEELGVTRVDLHATPMGAPLYRSMGFDDGAHPELRWSRLPRNACE
jgi:ribosomal protein S18 acetylase RimI-like enzyme